MLKYPSENLELHTKKEHVQPEKHLQLKKKLCFFLVFVQVFMKRETTLDPNTSQSWELIQIIKVQGQETESPQCSQLLDAPRGCWSGRGTC